MHQASGILKAQNTCVAHYSKDDAPLAFFWLLPLVAASSASIAANTSELGTV